MVVTIVGVFLLSVVCCALASQCPTDIPDHCMADVRNDLRPLMASIGNTASVNQVVDMCRVVEHDITPVRECVVRSVSDHCPAKSTLLRQLGLTQQVCKASIQCPNIKKEMTEVQEGCAKHTKAKTDEALLRGRDMCNVLREGLRCITSKLRGCPALVTAYTEVFEELEDSLSKDGLLCASASLTNSQNYMQKHVILRRSADCTRAASTIHSCSMEFVHQIMERPTDTVFVCSKTRDFVQNCIAANTINCPRLRTTILNNIPEAQKRMLERTCGSNVFNMDGGGTTPSWYATCDTQKATQCVPKYTQHIKKAMKQFIPPRNLSTFNGDSYLRKIKQGLMDMVDFNVLCRMMIPRETTIRPCLAGAFESCTNHELREQYYTGILKLLDFCKLAQNCSLFGKANNKMKVCFGTKFDELMSHARATGRPIDQSTTCRYVQDLAMCMYTSYDVCPRAQTFIRQKKFSGSGLQRMSDHCPGLTLTFPESGSVDPSIGYHGYHGSAGSETCSDIQLQNCLNVNMTSGPGAGSSIANMMGTLCRKVGQRAEAVKACLQRTLNACNRDPQATNMQKFTIRSSLSQVDFCVVTEKCSRRNDVYSGQASCVQALIDGGHTGNIDQCGKIQENINCMYEAAKPCTGAWTSIRFLMTQAYKTNVPQCQNIHIPSEDTGSGLSTGAIVAVACAVTLLALIFVGTVWWVQRYRRKNVYMYNRHFGDNTSAKISHM